MAWIVTSASGEFIARAETSAELQDFVARGIVRSDHIAESTSTRKSAAVGEIKGIRWPASSGVDTVWSVLEDIPPVQWDGGYGESSVSSASPTPSRDTAASVKQSAGGLSWVTDITFEQMVTPSLLGFAYLTWLVLAFVASIVLLLSLLVAIGRGELMQTLGVLSLGIALFGVTVSFRVACECAVVVFKGVGYLSEIAQKR
jgi:hypothetical protein